MKNSNQKTTVVKVVNTSKDMDIYVKATYGAPDHPLRIGDIEIPCYVLEDNRRVITQTGLVKALGMARGSSRKLGSDRLVNFTSAKIISQHVSQELIEAINNPIKLRTTKGAKAFGYEATVLADICEAVLKADDAGELQDQQRHIAQRAKILIRGFARVGIIALVDEATGYQEVRARQALEEILQKFISKELAKWSKQFPGEYYAELFRLRNLKYSEFSSKRPIIIAKLTNQIVYERLAPGVLEEMKKRSPKDDKGRRRNKYYNWLTGDIGLPALQEHLIKVITLMKAAPDWRSFERMINRALPSYKGSQLDLGFDDE